MKGSSLSSYSVLLRTPRGHDPGGWATVGSRDHGRVFLQKERCFCNSATFRDGSLYALEGQWEGEDWSNRKIRQAEVRL